MVWAHGADHPSQWAAIEAIASTLGCTSETRRRSRVVTQTRGGQGRVYTRFGWLGWARSTEHPLSESARAVRRGRPAARHSPAPEKIEALRRVGELLKASERNKGAIGRPGPGRGKRHPQKVSRLPGVPPTLAEQGLTARLSSLAQHLATSANVERPAGIRVGGCVDARLRSGATRVLEGI